MCVHAHTTGYFRCRSTNAPHDPMQAQLPQHDTMHTYHTKLYHFPKCARSDIILVFSLVSFDEKQWKKSILIFRQKHYFVKITHCNRTDNLWAHMAKTWFAILTIRFARVFFSAVNILISVFVSVLNQFQSAGFFSGLWLRPDRFQSDQFLMGIHFSFDRNKCCASISNDTCFLFDVFFVSVIL